MYPLPQPPSRDSIVAEAMTWIGTPWHHRARVKGAGVDCVMFLAEVFEAAGAIPHVEPEEYPIDVMYHKGGDRIIPWLEKFGDETFEPRKADVVLYKFAHSFSHAGILVDDGINVIHAFRSYQQVVVTQIEEGLLLDRPRRYFAFRGIA